MENSIQQQKAAKGIVKDESGEIVIGAAIVVQGTTHGSITDFDGNFSIENVEIGSKLIVKYMGYKDAVVVWNGTPLVVTLATDALGLDEVVVVGYGVTKKESLTGAMQNIKSDKLKDITTPSVENMLNGKVAGVYVAPGSGQPGSGGAVVIRGKSTINGSTSPLWVIDGVIVGSSPGALNPSDIDNMTILKDAASTAIYGSQGANGVIVVTTKRAKDGQVTVNVSAKVGVTTLNNGNLSMMNGEELYDYYRSFNNQEMIVFPRWNEQLRNSNFNWWDEATHTGFAQDYNLSISGGNEKSRSLFTAGYYGEDGAVQGYLYDRFNVRFRNEYTPIKGFTIKPAFYGSMTNVDNRQRSVTSMYSNLPWDSPYNEDGSLVPHRSPQWVNSNSTNYLYDLQWNKGTSKSYELSGNLDFEVKITDWLTFHSVNSYRINAYSYNYYTDPQSDSGAGVNGRIEEQRSESVRRYTNQLLHFNKMFGEHSLNAKVGYEFNDYTYSNVRAIGTGFVPGFNVLDVTALPEKVGGGKSEWAVQSMLMDVHYSYKNRYLAQLLLRRDGASNFGTNAQYGNFFSVSAGWNINREDWFKADWVDNLKIRASYGSVGNRPSALYPQYDLYAIGMSASYNGVPGALISQIGNKDMTWEKTLTTGIGVDFSMLNNRVRATIDWYNKNTSNLLYAVPVSGLTGVTSVWQNVGELRNRGIEVTVGGDIIRNKDWTWSMDLNIGSNKNTILSLYEGMDQIIASDGTGMAGTAQRLWKPGMDADTWYLREWAGVNTETGAPEWYKYTTNTDGSVTQEKTSNYAQATETTVGSSNPDFFGGLNTGLTWKNLSLDAVFGFSVGGTIYNYSRSEYDSDGAYTDRNQMNLQNGWSRWENPGDVATHPVASYNNSSNSNKVSSRYLEKGDYFKLRSLTLAYDFELKSKMIRNLRLSLAAENLFVITDYSGVDPEIPASSGSVLGTTTASVYPSTRKFMLGANFTF
ncbi:MAG: SusC/RagA family TonB-linked outer membrane protein [Phocaeicola sp.]